MTFGHCTLASLSHLSAREVSCGNAPPLWRSCLLPLHHLGSPTWYDVVPGSCTLCFTVPTMMLLLAHRLRCGIALSQWFRCQTLTCTSVLVSPTLRVGPLLGRTLSTSWNLVFRLRWTCFRITCVHVLIVCRSSSRWLVVSSCATANLVVSAMAWF